MCDFGLVEWHINPYTCLMLYIIADWQLTSEIILKKIKKKNKKNTQSYHKLKEFFIATRSEH